MSKCPCCGMETDAVVASPEIVCETPWHEPGGLACIGLQNASLRAENAELRARLADMTTLAVHTGDEGTCFYYRDAYEEMVERGE